MRPASFPSETTASPPPNAARSIPAEKCLPVEAKIIARTSPLLSISRISPGNSVQNSGIIELRRSGRFIVTVAIPSEVSTSKHVICSVIRLIYFHLGKNV